jgi:hypothetical protein
MRVRTLTIALLLGAILGPATAPASAAAPAPIGHVWVIVLENENYATTFSATSKAPYLAHTLTAQGAFLPEYYGIGHASLDNYIAMISGQGPNPVTQADCQFYQDVVPGTMGADGQAQGVGCVYPAAVPTLANQLAGRGLAWRGYMEDIGNSTTQPTTCRHPDLNSQDTTQQAHAGDQYAARHDPFVYFHSIIDNAVSCSANVVGLDRLPEDLRSMATTPSYSFVTPNLCHDGHDSPCVDGQPGGLVSADQFLRTWVPQIVAAPAYQKDGLLAIIFDEAGSDSSACCGEQAANTPVAGGQSGGAGGGKVGAVLLSPYIEPGTVSRTPYNHYSLLRSVEDIFGLPHLGYAAANGLVPLGPDVFSSRRSTTTTPTVAQVAGCTSSPLGAVRGRVKGGTLIKSSTVIRRVGGKPALDLSFAHAARLRIGVVSAGHVRRLASRRVRPCNGYLIALPTRHGRANVTATAGRVWELQTVRY